MGLNTTGELMTAEAEKQIKTFVTVRAAEVRRAESRVNDALYWAKSAIEGAERYVTTSGGAGITLNTDLAVALTELKALRGALHEAMKLAKQLGVDVEQEVAMHSLAYVPGVTV